MTANPPPLTVFLRILEYYEGILFLTTNRVENMDAAFQSRIHVSMEYPGLNISSRRHVWSNFLSMSKYPNELSDSDLELLAAKDLNGRQIKNLLKTSQLLACRKDSPLKLEHINTVINIEKPGAKRNSAESMYS
jgi:AAA+ superfamily predicted ATPase